jgi:glucose/arabinose dehydrogenase
MLAVAAAILLAAPAAARGAVTLAQIGTFSSPTYLTAPPGDGSRLFVVEQGGTIRVIRDGAALPAPFLDISPRVLSGGERGLLSMAFAPDYATSGLFYAYYTDRNGNIQVDEYRRSANPDVADPSARRAVFSVAHPQFANHNGGQLEFGPDGLLYAGTGDGGSGGDPNGNGQNPNAMLGKLLRIDPRGAGATPSVYAIGLRNPWRFSFDRQTSDLVIGDVGQDTVEEIDFAPAPRRGQGLNFGWNKYEGNLTYPGGAPAPSDPGFTFPVITHTHSDGWISITGGYVVRDPGLPDLAGRYVYGDFGKGDIWSATLPAASDDRPTGLHVDALSSFGEDACGRVYALSLNGPVYRLEEGASTCGASSGAPPPAPPAASSSAPDRTAPSLRLRLRSRQHTARHFRVVLACDERCHVTLYATALGRTAALRRKVVLAAGAFVSLRPAIRRATRALIARRTAAGRTVALRVRITAADDAGNRVTRRVVLRISRGG